MLQEQLLPESLTSAHIPTYAVDTACMRAAASHTRSKQQTNGAGLCHLVIFNWQQCLCACVHDPAMLPVLVLWCVGRTIALAARPSIYTC